MAASPERPGVLVIRAWVEPDETTLRARITGRLDVALPQEAAHAVFGVDSAAAIVRDWLEEVERGPVGSVTEA